VGLRSEWISARAAPQTPLTALVADGLADGLGVADGGAGSRLVPTPAVAPAVVGLGLLCVGNVHMVCAECGQWNYNGVSAAPHSTHQVLTEHAPSTRRVRTDYSLSTRVAPAGCNAATQRGAAPRVATCFLRLQHAALRCNVAHRVATWSLRCDELRCVRCNPVRCVCTRGL
jgi:hypothetical protein